MEEPQDEWVRVGGKGRPRRTPEQQQKHLQDRAAAAAALAAATGHSDDSSSSHQHLACQTAADQSQQQPQACTPEQQQAAQQQLQALAAAMAGSTPPKQAALPGWGPPREPEWKVACSSRSKKNKKLQLPSTPQEQAQYVAKQVREIQGQLASSAMYASLLAAMRQAAPGLTAGAEGSSTADTQQQQQQQQQQQWQGGSGSSSSSGACWSWGEVQQLVVYGLGSPDDSKVSRHQGLLPGLTQPPLLYDPAFSEADSLLMQALGLAVIEHNEEGRHSVEGPTLFYLPHCEAGLTDNLLCANAAPEQQHCLVLLGNSFATYQARWAAPAGSRPSTVRPDRLLQLVNQGSVVEVCVPDHGYHVSSAFNDMSLHTFKP